MGVIYPAGSIIGRKKDNKKFCIIEIAKDGYYVADYLLQGTKKGVG